MKLPYFEIRNFAMKYWLETNPGGPKMDVEVYFNALSGVEKKVSLMVC
jgi:hypothetical protein